MLPTGAALPPLLKSCGGGASGPIEFVGVTQGGSIPVPGFATTAGVWTNFQFDVADPDWAYNYIFGSSLVAGSDVAAPVFADVMSESLRLLAVPPDALPVRDPGSVMQAMAPTRTERQ